MYAAVYSALVEWLKDYLPEATARRVVRVSLADLYRWACNAVPTTYGPFGDVAEACMARALGMDMLPDAPKAAWPLATLEGQCDRFHYDVACIYAAVYAFVYEADFDMHDREALYQMIRTHDPEKPPCDLTEETILAACAANPVLRRVVLACESHRCDGRLICQVTEQMWEDEHRRGSEWMVAHTSREAIAPWPESGS